MSRARNRAPGPSPSQLSSQTADHDDRLALVNPLRPWFRWDFAGATADSVIIATKPTLCSDAIIRLPFRILGSDWVYRRPLVLETTAATIDLSTAGLGGRVDGIAVANSTDYLLWAFATNPYAPTFVGFGVTTRPRIAATTSLTGGTVGSSTVFTVAAGEGFRFVVGARILAREGTAIGNDYNQGIITATSSTTITATLDAAYSPGTQANATIASPVELIQLDNFAPTVPGQLATYGNSNGAYQYTYVGMIRSDAASGIFCVRTPGDFYPLPPTLILTTAVASAGTEVILARWIPIGVSLAEFGMDQTVTGVAAASSARLDHPDGSVSGAILQTDAVGTVTTKQVQNGLVSIRPRYSSIRYVHVIGGVSGSTINGAVRGYYEEKW